MATKGRSFAPALCAALLVRLPGRALIGFMRADLSIPDREFDHMMSFVSSNPGAWELAVVAKASLPSPDRSARVAALAGVPLNLDVDLPAGVSARKLSELLADPARFVDAYSAAVSATALRRLGESPDRFEELVSPSGRWRGWFESAGRFSVIDGPAGRFVFDQGNYFSQLSAAPLGFLSDGVDEFVIVGVDWDALELWRLADDSVSLAATVSTGGVFAGRLAIDPSAMFMAMEGWVWHPVSAVALAGVAQLRSGQLTWPRLSAFENVFNRPMCWLDRGGDPLLAVFATSVADDMVDHPCPALEVVSPSGALIDVVQLSSREIPLEEFDGWSVRVSDGDVVVSGPPGVYHVDPVTWSVERATD